MENSVKNIKTAWILQFVHILCQFISRTVIIRVLTIEYVGLSGLFSNVLTMLSLAELGIGEAIIFSLYKPIAEEDHVTINAIMRFYKKIYISVGVFIMIAGLALTPYIGHFIKEMPDIPEIYTIYALYVINSSVSYFFSYKAAYVTATQKNYLVVVNTGLWEILMVAVQIIVLFTTGNYVMYMIIAIISTLSQNLTITYVANRKYPYLKEKNTEKIPKDIFRQIEKNTGAMVFHKIGTIVVFATDNLILSKFVGLISVGIYTNYVTITKAVDVFIQKFFNAITASVGNLAVEETVEVQEKMFFRVFFMDFWLYLFSCCCLFNLLNPFIGDVWLGRDFLFGKWIVLLIVLKIYFTGMRKATQTFKNAKGLYWYNKYMPIYESLINLVTSLALVIRMGVAGVVLGTIISSVLTCVWIEPHVLYKYGFKKSAKEFYLKYISYFAVFCMIMLLMYFVNTLLPASGINAFIIKCFVNLVLPNAAVVLLYNRTDEFKYLMKILRRKVK